MNIRALSSSAVAIALAAISFSGSAAAVPLLCEDVALQVAMQSFCPNSENAYVKNKHRIDYLFDAGTPGLTSALSSDWHGMEVKSKPGAKKHDERVLHHWHPLWSSGGWSVGRILGFGGKWTPAQLHRGEPPRNVPEPSSLVLLGIGLIGAGLSRRIKRVYRRLARCGSLCVVVNRIPRRFSSSPRFC